MNEESDVFVDPAIEELHERIDGLQRQLNQWEPALQVFSQWQASAKVEAFKNEEFKNGELRHPLFDELKTEMASLLMAGKADDLNEAYKIAKLNSKEG